MIFFRENLHLEIIAIEFFYHLEITVRISQLHATHCKLKSWLFVTLKDNAFLMFWPSTNLVIFTY